jgi:flagellar motor protein MotB
MSSLGTSVTTERRGYGRGLILGLTMAETMLLLVFCLLLAVGAIVMKEREAAEAANAKVAAAEERAVELEASNTVLLEQLKELTPTGGKQLADEEWRELVVAKDAIDAVELSGLSPADVKALAPSIAVLREHGMAAPGGAAELEAIFRNAAENGKGDSKPHGWPPIINLSEASGFSFKVGSAELDDDFKAQLRGEISTQIADIASKYEVDVIEVIGHTDEQPISGVSNIDHDLKAVLDGSEPIGSLHPADNAGLGLARALAVANVLKGVPELEGLTVLPMSGAQLILPDDSLADGAQAGDVKARRRIEIRVRKRSQTSQPEITSN